MDVSDSVIRRKRWKVFVSLSIHISSSSVRTKVPMIKVKTVKEKNGKGTPLQTVIQYWTKDGVLVAEGRVNQLDEPEIN